MQTIKHWLTRQLANPQIALLAILLIASIAIITLLGDILAPFFAAVIIAYLLDGIILRLQRHAIPRLLALSAVFIAFLITILLIAILLIPNILNQLQTFAITEIPNIVQTTSKTIQTAQQRYQTFRQTTLPNFLNNQTTNTNQTQQTNQTNPPPPTTTTNTNTTNPTNQTTTLTTNQTTNTNQPPTTDPPPDLQEIEQLTQNLQQQITNLIKTIPNTLLNLFKNLPYWIIYLILIPVLVFFLLKDKNRILTWLNQFLPKDRTLATQIWHDVNTQISNYIRGKFWEIIIVWIITYLTFTLLKLKFALLLSLFVGLSVIIPYIGAAIMYIPITLIASYQFGWSPMLLWTLITYTTIQILDGNLLSPILLSEATDLHPVAVILAILIFGGIWGFWGVFFAIPLATLINAVIKSWPKELNPTKTNHKKQPTQQTTQPT